MKNMLCVVVQIHRNILSSQCYIRFIDDSNSVDAVQVDCLASELRLLLLLNNEIVKKVKIITPKDLFIPSSLTSNSKSSVKGDSTVVCPTTLTERGQSVAEFSFRLQISGVDTLGLSESELKVDVKDFFKERFKNGVYWDLFCASCGKDLPLEPLLVESVREYCESELSEGWFCHGSVPQEAFKPSSQILYVDDVSFYLQPRPDLGKCCEIKKNSKSLHTSCFNNHDTNCQKDNCCNDQSTGHLNYYSDSHSDQLAINDLNKSADNFCHSKNADQYNNVDINFLDFSKSPGLQNNHLTPQTLNYADAKEKSYLDLQDLNSSVSSNGCCKHSSLDNYENSVVSENENNSSKILHSVVKCQCCGDVLSTEKAPFPFTRFYFDKLVFKNSSFNDDHVEYAHRIALHSFWSLVTKSQATLLPAKLFLQSKTGGEDICLLLWIPNATVAQFLLQDPLEGACVEVDLKTEPVYKVLYFSGASNSENVRSWRHDFGVDFYRVSDTMVKTLVEILDSSSRYLSETAGGFSCGFLRVPSHAFDGSGQEKV